MHAEWSLVRCVPEQWRVDCKKAKELGQKPPLPPQQQKKLEARKAKKEGVGAAGDGGKNGAPADKKAKADAEAAAVETADAMERNARRARDAKHMCFSSTGRGSL